MRNTAFPFLHLVVIHYHWRPGGVRKVVELTLPAILRAADPDLKKVTLLSGSPLSEYPLIEKLEVAVHSEPAFDYLSGQLQSAESIASHIRAALGSAIPSELADRTLIWFHNPGLARNGILNREVMDFCEKSGASLILHHHDFWCAGRWARWEELARCGWNTLEKVAGIAIGKT